MTTLKVGIIGTGLRHGTPGATGYGMAHAHAAGYEASPDAEIVAVADINPVALKVFCDEHNVPRGYSSADEMLANEELDIVSICVWPHLHAPMTIKVAEAGVKAGKPIKAIHCEKPMALTYGDAKKMVEVCDANNVLLTFNHMRRFGAPYRKAKALLKEGAIGELERLEAYTSNLYDWGTHWFDMLFFYNDETPVEWVIGQTEAKGSPLVYGVMMEGQGLSFFKYANGVAGLMVTGSKSFYGQGAGFRSGGCGNRLIGSKGTIEVAVEGGPELRIRSEGTGGVWQTIELEPGGLHGSHLHVEAIADLIDALRSGREPELSGHRALQTAELIFATYESSRRRGRVDLPLDIEDAPFSEMLNNDDITTWPEAYVGANGIKLHYWRTGDGSKPPLVLCHGFSDNGLCWTPVARALEADFDVIMYDARGHGLSDAPDEGYTTKDHAADLAGLVKALGLEKPAILGHSMGGSTVGMAAATTPELFGKVLLEDPAWREDTSPRQAMSEEEREAWVHQRRDNIVAQSKLSRKALIAMSREQSPTWSAAERGPWATSKQQFSPNVVTGRKSKPRPWREIAAAIESPTLLITADIDKGAIITTELAKAAEELNAMIKVAHIAGVGHSIRREDSMHIWRW
ncbi:MAG: alpha/beta fold hydrolase [Anaerolineae bacterium]|nr:alpha/beta fold hydrolase [Anaerolineae bacterium]